MSQQQNNQPDSGTMAMIIVAGCLLVFYLILYALAIFLAALLTGVSLNALKRPVTVYKWTITPEEARLFIGCGLIGMFGLPIFVVFCSAMFHFRIYPDYWLHMFLGGYCLGALWLCPMIFKAGQKEAAAAAQLLPPAPPPSGTSVVPSPPSGPWTPGAAETPFRFASWEDEFADGEAEAVEVVEAAEIVPPPPVSPPKRRPRRTMPIYRSEQP